VRKILVLTLVLLASAIWLQAQAVGQMGSQKSGVTTIQGCLQYTHGHYFLTDSGGTAHQLQSEANKLQAHVGHTVEITGKPGIRTVDTTVQGAASSAKEEQVFKVMSVKHVSDTCKAAGQ